MLVVFNTYWVLRLNPISTMFFFVNIIGEFDFYGQPLIDYSGTYPLKVNVKY